MDAIAVPVSLLVLSLACCADLYAQERKRLASIQLPKGDGNGYSHTQTQGQLDGAAEEEVGDSKREQQDVQEEGVPVEEERWWLMVRLRKAALIGVLTLLDATACVELGWDLMSGAKDLFGITEDSIMTGFWTLLAVLSILSFPKRNISRHWRYTIYLSVLTLTSSVSIWARLLIPSSAIVIPTASSKTSDSSAKEIASFALTVVTACLSLIAFILVGTLPRQPSCHFQSPYTYSVRSDTPEKHVANVSQNVEASVLGILLFTWVTPVIRLGHKKEQMGLDDLPHLSASFRTITLFRNIRSSAKHSVEKRLIKAKSSSAIEIVINKVAFVVNCGLAFVAAFLYYLPAFFLRKVVAFLEVSHQRDSNGAALGYAYCFGLLISLVINAILTQQLWYTSNCKLASRIKIQLNSVIFAKTLKRKDVTGNSSKAEESSFEDGTSTIKKSGKKEEPARKATQMKKTENEDSAAAKAESESFSSKTQVLNLFSVDCDRVGDCASWSFSLIDAPFELLIGTIFLYELLGYAGIVGIATTILFLPINHYTSKAFATVQDRLMAARDRRVSLMSEVLSSIRYIKFMAYERAFEQRILRAREEEIRQQRNNYLLE
ncbi:MAG: hypothetical protein CYPHOPRED_004772, partial [Cyphobasidiales sp. Tagirdzhanova-0007]